MEEAFDWVSSCGLFGPSSAWCDPGECAPKHTHSLFLFAYTIIILHFNVTGLSVGMTCVYAFLPKGADSLPVVFFRGRFFGVGLLGVDGDASTRLFSTALLCTKENTNSEANSCIYANTVH